MCLINSDFISLDLVGCLFKLLIIGIQLLLGISITVSILVLELSYYTLELDEFSLVVILPFFVVLLNI